MQSRLNKFLSQYNNEYMTIGQAKAEQFWFALCLTDKKITHIFLNPDELHLISELGEHPQ